VITSLVLMSIGTLVLLTACDEKVEYYTDRVLVLVGHEYRHKFLDGELYIEEFQLENIEKIEDSKFVDAPDYLMIRVYLKKKGVEHIQDAINNLNNLDFVLEVTTESVNKISIS